MKTLTGITKIFLSIFSSWWRTALLFFFILLMATLRAVINKEIKRVPIRKIDRKSCIDRTKSNVIIHNPIKKATIKVDTQTNRLIPVFIDTNSY